MRWIGLVVVIPFVLLLEWKFIMPFFQKMSDKIAARTGYSNFTVAKLLVATALILLLVNSLFSNLTAQDMFCAYLVAALYFARLAFAFYDIERKLRRCINAISQEVNLARMSVSYYLWIAYIGAYAWVVVDLHKVTRLELAFFILFQSGLYFGLSLTMPSREKVTIKSILAQFFSRAKAKQLATAPVQN